MAQLGSSIFHRMLVPDPAQQSAPLCPMSFDQFNVTELGTLLDGNAPCRLASLLEDLFGVKPLWWVFAPSLGVSSNLEIL